MNKKKTILLLFLLTSLFFCKNKNSTEIKVPGIVNGDIITIRSKATGTVNKLYFFEGQKVSKDKILLQIDPRILENKLSELPLTSKNIDIKIEVLKNSKTYMDANKKHLFKQITRFKRLLKNNSISGEKLENIELKFKRTITEINGIVLKINSLNIEKEKLKNKEQHLKLLLEDHTIKVPVDGIIIEKLISEGENIFPSKPVADILDLNSLYIEVFIEGEEISILKIGDKAQIFIDGLNKSYEGRVSYFGRKAEFSPKYVISEKERKALLYQVKVKIDKNIDIFKIGMPVTVLF